MIRREKSTFGLCLRQIYSLVIFCFLALQLEWIGHSREKERIFHEKWYWTEWRAIIQRSINLVSFSFIPLKYLESRCYSSILYLLNASFSFLDPFTFVSLVLKDLYFFTTYLEKKEGKMIDSESSIHESSRKRNVSWTLKCILLHWVTECKTCPRNRCRLLPSSTKCSLYCGLGERIFKSCFSWGRERLE
jgi:uncharacterized membrane protein